MPSKSIELTDKEREEIYISLSVRCGYIETGTLNRAKDLERAGQKDKIKVLSVAKSILEEEVKSRYCDEDDE